MPASDRYRCLSCSMFGLDVSTIAGILGRSMSLSFLKNRDGAARRPALFPRLFQIPDPVAGEWAPIFCNFVVE